MSDAAASFVKLGAGWLSDRLRRRKPFVVAGCAAPCALVGGLWTLWPTPGFGYGARMMAVGAGLMAREARAA